MKKISMTALIEEEDLKALEHLANELFEGKLAMAVRYVFATSETLKNAKEIMRK